MKRRLFLAAGMSALLVATLMPATASAGRGPDRRVDVAGRAPDVSKLPSQLSRDANGRVHVVVQLEGAPVTRHQANAGRDLTATEKANIRRGLVQRQSALRSQLRGIGASVLAAYTDSYNGLRVKVKASDLRRVATMRGVVGVTPVVRHYLENANTDRYIKASTTWSNPGFTGRGIRIAIIDSGINYYHRNFAGAGPAAMAADNDEIVEPGTFPTQKVVDGWDFVGDEYNPSDNDPTNDDPNPDPDPMDCKDPDSPNVQHGSHVAGTAAGTGVKASGGTYTGPYTASTLGSVDFRIAPGVAPRALLQAYRVFGCDGGTDLTLDAIELAVRDEADVINMSLGSSWGNPADSTAIASDNAVDAGVVVVTSAGNSGPSSYITGSPGTGTKVISTAAMDAVPSFPSVIIDMPTGDDIQGINANGETDDLPVTGVVNVFADNPATPCNADTGEFCEESGTHEDSYIFNGYVAGQIPVTFRGRGARIDRAKEGDAQGAPAVIMVNNSSGLPPFEGPIAGVDIPFVGVSSTAGPRFADGQSITIREGPELENPGYRHTAPFSSGGPRRFDNVIKPDITAPGVGTFSTDGSTANQGKSLSGTSMASPAVAGVAALVLQAHPSWQARFVKAAILGTAAASRIENYEVRRHGAGVVDARRATLTTDVALAGAGTSSLSFGYEQISKAPGSTGYSETMAFDLWNRSGSSVTYNLSNSFNGDDRGAAVTISPTRVTVPANSKRQVNVTVSMSNAAAAALPSQADYSFLGVDENGQPFLDMAVVAGAIKADPVQTGRNHYTVRVPWLLVPRGTSTVYDGELSDYTVDGDLRRTRLPVRNSGIHWGTADVFSWGLMDHANEGLAEIDLASAGAQTLPTEACYGDPAFADPDDRCLVFAVNLHNRYSSASANEIDVYVDLDGDGDPIAATGYEYLIVGFDIGQIFGIYDGVYGSFIFEIDEVTGALSLVNVWIANAPANSSTVQLFALASDIGLPKTTPVGVGGDPSTADTEFWYHVESFLYADDNPIDFPPFDIMTTGNHPSDGTQDARYDAFDPVVSNGNFAVLDPGEGRTFRLSIDHSRFHPRQGHKGWLVVSMDDRNGMTQADMVPHGDLP